MKRFQGLEGLRGVLAWAVVFSHLACFSDVYTHGFGALLARLGLPSVLIFVIISGFVITHAIIERPEPYRSYLTRRFMRFFHYSRLPQRSAISPVMSKCLRSHASPIPAIPSSTSGLVNGIASSNHQNFWLHVLAHLTMLHGAISDGVLPFSSYAFNIPPGAYRLSGNFM